MKEYFHSISNNNTVTNKISWNFVRPFLVNTGLLNSREEIMKRKEKKIITDNKQIVQVLNDHYINMFEQSCGQKPSSVAKKSHLTDDIKIVGTYLRLR